jgi:hypothetical protein
MKHLQTTNPCLGLDYGPSFCYGFGDAEQTRRERFLHIAWSGGSLPMSPTNERGQVAFVPAEPSGPERRRHLRFPFTASAEVTESKSGAKIAGRTSDLSLGGCYVDAISPFPVGADAHVRIQKGEDHFEAQVKVVYSQIGMGMGLAFVSAQPKHYRLFQKWLQEISGETPLPTDTPMQQQDDAEVAAGSVTDETSNVLNELLIALMRKRVLTEEEGKAMLKRLHR